MKNVFYYWSDKTKEDKKIIDLIHREVKLDKISPSQKKFDKFLFFFFFLFYKKNTLGDVLKFLAKIGN